jgi:hypothetical protein
MPLRIYQRRADKHVHQLTLNTDRMVAYYSTLPEGVDCTQEAPKTRRDAFQFGKDNPNRVIFGSFVGMSFDLAEWTLTTEVCKPVAVKVKTEE